MVMKFLQAKYYTPADQRIIELIVLHAMEEPEKGDTAEAVANYFAFNTTRKVSAHYCCDDDSEIQCVKDRDIAYAAPGANSNGLHIEQAGFTAQTAAQWADAYSSQMIREHVAPLVRAKAAQYSIPLVFLDADALKSGRRGITTHAEVTKAWHLSTHTDPGLGYPMGSMLNIARQDPKGEWDQMATKEEIRAVVREEIAAAALATHHDAVVILHGDDSHPKNISSIYDLAAKTS
jgi:N-acetyl-anhydromuramyl-L-alanine amidase AmpD